LLIEACLFRKIWAFRYGWGCAGKTGTNSWRGVLSVLCGVGVFKAITAGFDHPWKMLFWGASACGAAINIFKARNTANRNLTNK
jgi:hypothetical protein